MEIIIYMIITLILFIIWMILYKKHKKTIFSLPYLLIFFILPFYRFLDQYFFVKIFGCGCVPTDQTNMFNIPFNANDLSIVIYSILIIIATIIGVKLSKKINNKLLRVLYIILILVFNIPFSILVRSFHLWA